MNHVLPVILLNKPNINISYNTFSRYNLLIFSYLAIFREKEQS